MHFVLEGYPFASLYLYDRSEGLVEARVDLGPPVESYRVDLYSDPPLKEWVYLYSLGPYLEGVEIHKLASRIEMALHREAYVSSVAIASPYFDDGEIVFPVALTPYRDLFVNGYLGYSSNSSWVGDLDAYSINALSFGEQLDLQLLVREDEHRLGLRASFPVLGRLPFGASLGVRSAGVAESISDFRLDARVSSRLGGSSVLVELGLFLQESQVDSMLWSTRGGLFSSTYSYRFHPSFNNFLNIYYEQGRREREGESWRVQRVGGRWADFLAGVVRGGQLEIAGGAILYDGPEPLQRQERFLLGGHRTIRGYGEDLYSVLAYSRWRFEQLRILDSRTDLFLLSDGAVLFPDSFDWGGAKWLYSFGGGLRHRFNRATFTLYVARPREAQVRESLIGVSISN